MNSRRGIRRSPARTASCFVAVMLSCQSVAAVSSDEVRLWPAIAISAPLGPKLRVKLDGLVETTPKGSTTGLRLARVVAVWQAADRIAVSGGYTLVHGGRGPGPSYVEHRGLQELDLLLFKSSGGSVVTSRTRLEERRRENLSGTAIRLRNQMRLELPLKGGTRVVLWGEYFHNLGTTSSTLSVFARPYPETFRARISEPRKLGRPRPTRSYDRVDRGDQPLT